MGEGGEGKGTEKGKRSGGEVRRGEGRGGEGSEQEKVGTGGEVGRGEGGEEGGRDGGRGGLKPLCEIPNTPLSSVNRTKKTASLTCYISV